MAADADLTFPMLANARYFIRMFLRLNSASATPDFKFNFSGPAGFGGARWYEGNVSSTGEVTTFSGDQAVALLAGTDLLLMVEGHITCTADGTFALTWAQNISDATATTIKQGSFIEYFRTN